MRACKEQKNSVRFPCVNHQNSSSSWTILKRNTTIFSSRMMLYIHPSPSHLSNFPLRSVSPFFILCSRAEKMCLREDGSAKQLARAVTNLSVSMSGGEAYATKRNSNVRIPSAKKIVCKNSVLICQSMAISWRTRS